MSDTPASNPYAAPVSALQESPRDLRVPSIEEALSRGYDFNIGELLSEAWQRTKGTKGIIVGGFLLFYTVMMVASLALGGLFALLGLASDSLVFNTVVEIVLGLFASALAYPFMAGIGMVGIRRAADHVFVLGRKGKAHAGNIGRIKGSGEALGEDIQLESGRSHEVDLRTVFSHDRLLLIFLPVYPKPPALARGLGVGL